MREPTALNGTMAARVLVLDAMGVIYRHADDVAELLVPFVRARSRGQPSHEEIAARYREASLGRMTSRELWTRLGCDASCEDEYLSQHELRPGLLPFLAEARRRFDQVWCLSNDVSEWSVKLRSRHRLSPWFRGWVISGDVGLRKPSPSIYARLSACAGAAGAELLFVDDRRANVEVAAALGWSTVHFDLDSQADEGSCARIWASVLVQG